MRSATMRCVRLSGSMVVADGPDGGFHASLLLGHFAFVSLY